jgi:hypothetical protein
MANLNRESVGYGLSEALPALAKKPIVAKRAPLAADTGYPIGQLWMFPSVNLAYILTSIGAGVATWQLISASGNAGLFTTLTSSGNTNLATNAGSTFAAGNTTGTITIGGAAQTGAVNVGTSSGTVSVGIGNGTGANSVFIATGGTGSTAIGNATGVINLIGTVQLGNTGPEILFGAGAPTIAAPQGSLYINTTGNSTSTRMYINTNGTTGWTNFVTAA